MAGYLCPSILLFCLPHTRRFSTPQFFLLPTPYSFPHARPKNVYFRHTIFFAFELLPAVRRSVYTPVAGCDASNSCVYLPRFNSSFATTATSRQELRQS